MAERSETNTNKIGFLDSIKTKLITVMVLVMAIPLTVAVIVSYVTSTNKALADAQDSMEWEAWYIEDKYVMAMETNVSMIRSIAGNPT
ncbi:MAG: methyl-accepting chemotaxis protein, partial [Lachnospiraceae bacterium]|nr:methyl-accepting chemotaxis protein [Lachnospiraceae bacterium]